MRKIAVLGTPRSGTRYIRYALRKCGMDVNQESMAPDGTVCGFWAWEKETSEGRPPYHMPCSHQTHWNGKFPVLTYAGETFEHRFHLVRDPLDVMRTLPPIFREGVFGKWMRKLGFHGPGPWDSKLVSLSYWVKTNEKLIEMDLPVVRLEYIDTDWREFSSRYPELPDRSPLTDPVPKRLSQAAHPRPTWEDLRSWDPELAERAAEIAKRFGYL